VKQKASALTYGLLAILTVCTINPWTDKSVRMIDADTVEFLEQFVNPPFEKHLRRTGYAISLLVN